MRDLGEALDSASASRRGGLWVVTGDPGVGKSRLVEAFEQQALDRGFVPAWGRCWEGGAAPAYWPWRQVTSSLESLAAAPSPLSSDPTTEMSSRFELFDRVGRWLGDVCRDERLWICVEDLHAADVASLELLEALTPRLRGMPIVLVATARSSAFDPEAATAFHRLGRLGRKMNLGPMDASDARTLIDAFVPADAPALIEQAVSATGGHPLFLVELGRVLASSSTPADVAAALPASLDAALSSHLESLAPEHRAWLRRAAVVGNEIDPDVLEAAFGTRPDEAPVRQAIAQAVRLGLVTGAGDRCRFFHALLRDLLLRQLPPDEREALHASVADWLERSGTASPARLAYHLLHAGPGHRVRAIEASLRAAEASMRDLAHDDARAHLDAVATEIEAAAAPVPLARLALLRGMADLHEGALARGRQRCLDAANLALNAGALELAGRAALTAGRHLQFGKVDERLVKVLEAILAAIGDDALPRDALRVRLLARLAAAMQPSAEPALGIGLAFEAIELAEHLDDDASRIDTLAMASSALVDLVAASRRRPIDQRHLDLALRLRRPNDVLTAHLRLIMDSFELADADAVEHHLAAARESSLDPQCKRRAWLSPALLATQRLWAGDLDDTLELIENAHAMGEALGDRNVRGASAFQRLRFIELDGAEPELAREVVDQLGRLLVGTPAGEAICAVFAAQAWFQLGHEQAGLERARPDEVRLAWNFGDRTAFLGTARWALAAGDVELAREVIDTLGATPHLMLSDGVLGLCLRGSVATALAFAHCTLGDHTRALELATHAVAQSRKLGGWPVVAEAHAEVARIAHLMGRKALADDHAAKGRAIVADLDLPGLRWRFDRLDASPAAVVVPDTQPAPPDVPAEGPTPPKFVDEGDVWCVRWHETELRLKHTKGLGVLARLVGEPDREFHVLDLTEAAVAPGDPGTRDGGELLDAAARESYRARATDLREALREAEAHNDYARHAELSRELEFLTDELARATGLGGRSRRNAGAEERARQAVRKQIRGALDRIASLDAELGQHLQHRVRTGRYCAYSP